MLFITAGMGGGTGTGAAPVVAEIAKRLGILTVAVVTRPFEFEGKRQQVAQAGIEELQKHVDSLIIIPNDKLIDVLGGKVTRLQAFEAANDVLHGAVAGIAEIITNPGDVNVDFADVRTVMGEVGMAMMGSAIAGRRESRARGGGAGGRAARCSRTSTSRARAACWSTSPRPSSLQDGRVLQRDEHDQELHRRGRDRDRRHRRRRGDGRCAARDDGRDRASAARASSRTRIEARDAGRRAGGAAQRHRRDARRSSTSTTKSSTRRR